MPAEMSAEMPAERSAETIAEITKMIYRYAYPIWAFALVQFQKSPQNPNSMLGPNTEACNAPGYSLREVKAQLLVLTLSTDFNVKNFDGMVKEYFIMCPFITEDNRSGALMLIESLRK